MSDRPSRSVARRAAVTGADVVRGTRRAVVAAAMVAAAALGSGPPPAAAEPAIAGVAAAAPVASATRTATKSTAKPSTATKSTATKSTAKPGTKTATTATATTVAPGASGGAATGGGGLDAATIAAARGLPAARGPASGEPYRIGLLLPAGGVDPVVAETAQEQRRGVDLAIAFVNELGGIGGRPLALVTADGSGATAVAGFNRLADRDDIVGVIGPTLSSDLAALAPVAQARQTLLLGASTSARGVPQLGSWVRRVALPADVVARAATASIVAARPATRAIVLATGDDAATIALGRAYSAALSAEGLTVVPVEVPFVRAQTNNDELVAAVGSIAPDLVVVVAGPSDAALFVRSLRNANARPVVMVDSAAATATFASTCGPTCDGVFSPVIFDPEDSSTFARATLLRRYHDAYGTSPTLAAAQGFAALQVLAIGLDDALAKGGATTSAQRRSALRASVLAGRYDTPLGLLSFTPEGEVKVDAVSIGSIRVGTSGPARVVGVTTTVAAARATT